MKHLLSAMIALVICSSMACHTTRGPAPDSEPAGESSTSTQPTSDPGETPSHETTERNDSAAPSTPSCEPVEMSESPLPKATAEFQAFRKKTKALGEKVSEEFGRVTWALSPSTEGSKSAREAERVKIAEICGGWVGEPVPQSNDHEARGDCLVEFQLGGAAAVIDYITECSSDACSTTSYIWRQDQRSPVRVEQPADFVNVAPGGEFVFYSAEGEAPMDRYTYRASLSGDQKCVVTNACFSPRLSPDGSYLLCRNFEGDVLKVGPDGGAPEQVAKAELPEGRVVYVRLQWKQFPQPVEFVAEGRIEYTLTHSGSSESSTPQTKEVTIELP